ncbi:heme-binding protein [Accumulibacter sp.]|uniref:SOUL family heme-binding protein n=1 Tax=Accumulibacter sp. TaxID=2053492 RepID=UPI0025863D4C|nr:heme-binding protein [Accumulibacter sp.]
MTRFHHLAACILFAAWSPAMAVEEPQYQVVRSYEAFEVRRYEPYLVAEAVVSAAPDEAGNQGFRILSGYIFGQNKGARRIEMTAPVAQAPTRIAMTAPVAQSPGPGGFVIQFAMPQEWTLETLPEPLDSRITLRAIPARTFAVIGYSGTWSRIRYEENLRKLQDALADAGLSWHGEPMWARYDPPWKPWFWRRNEIWLELD